ncbi:MAG TPA: PAS domain S-box protein, partial [Terriglobales bacterium]|nr:PAS domain S-box protein [Terriglobales bacterium]
MAPQQDHNPGTSLAEEFLSPALGRDLRAALQQARQELQAERAYSQALIDSLPVMFVIIDKNGRFVRWNHSLEQVLHYSAAELVSVTAFDTIAPEGRDLMRGKILEAMEKGFSEAESALLSKEGVRIPYYLTSAPLLVEGQPCIAGVGIDISARKAAEEQLRQSESRYRLLFERSLAGIFRYQADEGLVECNEAGAHILGYESPQELLYRKAESYFVHAGDLEGALQRLARDGVLSNLEVCLLRNDSTPVWILENLSVTESRDGQPFIIEGTFIDISERKRAEDEVRRLNSELYQKIAEATSANQELEAFSYSVSHDLRAPIRHINGFVDMLQRRTAGALDETAQRHLQTIARASQHMGQLIDDLLAFSRMGRGELARSRVSLGSLAREAIENLRPELDGRSVEFKVGGLPDVTGDPAMLRVVLSNLLSNAVKYTRPQAQAVIQVGQVAGGADEVVLFVKDNGVGFEMQYADKLFGVFQRLHRSDQFEGTGIGLATVRRIVHRHGGRTWAEATVDGGATFYVAFPARAQG